MRAFDLAAVAFRFRDGRFAFLPAIGGASGGEFCGGPGLLVFIGGGAAVLPCRPSSDRAS